MKISEVQVADATLTLIGAGPDDPPVVSDEELRQLRALTRRDDAGRRNLLVEPAVLERIIETIAISNSRARHSS